MGHGLPSEAADTYSGTTTAARMWANFEYLLHRMRLKTHGQVVSGSIGYIGTRRCW
jgi:hypothetical protein